MNLTFNAFALILIGSGIFTFIYAWYIIKNGNAAVRWFGLLILSNAFYCSAYGLELASHHIEQVKLFINIEYIGVTTLPVTWFLFCLKMAGKDHWYKNVKRLLLFFLIPALTLLLVWTNDYHHLYYKDLYMDYSNQFPMVVVRPGIGYLLYNTYFYLLFVFGSWLLINKLRHSDLVFKKQNLLIIVAAIFPALGNMAYLIGIRPLGNLDLTPFSFLVSIIFITIGIFRLRIFNILPVAREKVLELMQDGFMILDDRNHIIDCNAAFKRYLDEDANIIGKRVEDIFSKQFALSEFLALKISGKLDLCVETANESFDLEADIRYFQDGELNKEIIIVKFQDQTALKRETLKIKEQSEELKKLNQQKDRIFSIIAHDLRGPLVNISEVLKMIADDTLSPEEFKFLAPSLSKDITYTKELLENILHWSRSQLKGYGINKETFSLNKLLTNEINYHLPIANLKEVRIVSQLEDEISIHCDNLMAQIVVRNIINNAIKFSNAGGLIKISVARITTNYVYLDIEDNGTGMPQEVSDILFTNSNVTTRGTMNEKGTGLGMMICKEFMQKNDGDISVKSKVGKGTTFSLSFPTSTGR